LKARLMVTLALDIEADDLRVAPGASVTFTVQVHNIGTVVDRYRCQILGLDPSWSTVSPPKLELFPLGAAEFVKGGRPPSTGRFTVIVHPPRSPVALAKRWPVGALVWSEHDQTVRATEETNVEILPFDALAGELHPTELAGESSARSTLLVRNQGNRTEDLAIRAFDAGDALEFRLHPASVRLEPGAGAEVGVQVSVKDRTAGVPDRPRAFVVEITGSASTIAPLRLNATFETRAVPASAPSVAPETAGARATAPDKTRSAPVVRPEVLVILGLIWLGLRFFGRFVVAIALGLVAVLGRTMVVVATLVIIGALVIAAIRLAPAVVATVPDLYCTGYAQAEQRLGDAGLQIRGKAGPPGEVILHQDPLPNAVVAHGTGVSVTWGPRPINGVGLPTC
jgi:hypothetical protein